MPKVHLSTFTCQKLIQTLHLPLLELKEMGFVGAVFVVLLVAAFATLDSTYC